MERPTLQKPDFETITEPRTLLTELVNWYSSLHEQYLWSQIKLQNDPRDPEAKKAAEKYKFAKYPGAHVRHAGINDAMRSHTFYDEDGQPYQMGTKAIMELTDELVNEGVIFKRISRGGPMLSNKPFNSATKTSTNLMNID